MRFEVTGVLSDLDEDTLCSVHTPAACELLSEARANGPGAVLRLGYSAVGSGPFICPCPAKITERSGKHVTPTH